VLHSGLTDAERRDERERIARGESRVVVGARSAVFAPLRDVGVICVDEEHDQSYKQESDPRYDARTVAAKRAALEGAVAIYGSATPRPESWERLERLELGGRFGGSLPGCGH
jgi:primosomal protein N' (replication factor Y)